MLTVMLSYVVHIVVEKMIVYMVVLYEITDQHLSSAAAFSQHYHAVGLNISRPLEATYPMTASAGPLSAQNDHP